MPPPHADATNRQRDHIASIQWLRALAALAVVAWHAENRWRETTQVDGTIHSFAGQSGVDLFFVISGFVMWLSVVNRPQSVTEFLRRRISRIVPLYWFYTSVLVLGALLLPAALPSVSLTPVHVLQSYLFLPTLRPDSGYPWPVLGQGWTLNYEMFFYAVFALAVLGLPGARRRLMPLTAVLVGLVVLGLVFRPAHVIAATYTSPLLLEFLAGVWIAVAWRAQAIDLRPAIAVTLLGSGLAAIVASSYVQWPEEWRALVWGGPSTAILIGGLALNRHLPQRPSLVSALGDASYSVYLSHSLVIAVLAKLMEFSGVMQTSALSLFVLLALLMSSAVGWVSYRLLELPVIAWTRNARRSHRVPLRAVT